MNISLILELRKAFITIQKRMYSGYCRQMKEAKESYLKNETFLVYYGLFCTFLVLCFGNIYLGWRHKRHYTKHVKNVRNGHPEETVEVEINNDQIRMIDKVSDSSVKISEITLVNEIRDYYFLKLSTGSNVIIPKTLSVLNDEVYAYLLHLHLKKPPKIIYSDNKQLALYEFPFPSSSPYTIHYTTFL